MKVKTDHGTYDVPAITFKARRELHKLELGAITADGQIKPEAFYDVLDWVLNYAFDDPEKSLGKLDDNGIDAVLMSIYNAYKNIDEKK